MARAIVAASELDMMKFEEMQKLNQNLSKIAEVLEKKSCPIQMSDGQRLWWENPPIVKTENPCPNWWNRGQTIPLNTNQVQSQNIVRNTMVNPAEDSCNAERSKE